MKGMLVKSILGMLVASSPAWSAEKRCEFAPATFEGQGSWDSFADERGSYDVTTEFNGSTIESVYKFGDGKTFKLHMKITDNNGSCVLDVEADAKRGQGHGHCNPAGCTYRVKSDDLRLEEHFMIQNNALYRVGFKVYPSEGDKGIISWAEKLPKK